MSGKSKTFADLLAEDEAERLRKAKIEQAKFDSPEEAAKRVQRRQKDFDKGVRLGWWDKNGNPITSPDDEVDDEELNEDESE